MGENLKPIDPNRFPLRGVRGTKMIAASELILNPDGSVYHINLKPGQIANDIIFVGDQNRCRENHKTL